MSDLVGSFAFRFVFFYSAAVFLSVVLECVLYERESRSHWKFGLVLEAIAKTVAPQIDGRLLDDVQSNEDATSSPFQTVRSVLSRVMRDNNLRASKFIYFA